MGLDIYLNHRGPDFEAWKKKAEEYGEISEANWKAVGGYDKASEKQKEEVRAKNDALIVEMGLGKYGGVPDEGEQQIELDSEKYPENYFKIGYCRSSYNDSGMNSVFRNLGVPDLYDIFGKDVDDYEFTPDWEASKERVCLAIEQLRGINESDYGKYRAIEADIDLSFMKSITEADEKRGDEHVRRHATDQMTAKQLFVEQLEMHKKDEDDKTPGPPAFTFTAYSNGLGDFFLNGIKVFGLIKGTKEHFRGANIPCIYVIAENEEAYDWYLEALEVVEETIDYVLAQDDPENYCLHWSG